MEYIFFFLVVIVLIIIYLKNSEAKEMVFKTSENVKNLLILNKKYEFLPIMKKIRVINFMAKSKSNFDTISFASVVLYYIENDRDDLRQDINNAIENGKKYSKYMEEYNSLSLNINEKILSELKISKTKYLNYEKKLMKKYKIKNNFNLLVKVIISYVTPKGRNHYEKIGELNLFSLINIYAKWQVDEEYKKTAKYERLRMKNSIRYDVLRRDKFRCQICGAEQSDGVKLHVDHIIPVSKGGKTEMNNLRTLCDKCNLGKSDKIEI